MIKNNPKRQQIKPRFVDQKLTNYAGLAPFSAFMNDKLNFSELVENNCQLPIGNNTIFDTSQILSTIVFGYLTSFDRIKQFEELSKDLPVQKLLGLPKHIDEDTIAHRLNKFGSSEVEDLQFGIDKSQQKVHSSYDLSDKEKILDIDSTVITVYGNQEKARKGFNPYKRGNKSYHSILGFLNGTKECINSRLRPGNVHTSKNVDEFLRDSWNKLPGKNADYLIRADSGYFSDDFISEIEDKGADYLIKIKRKNFRKFMKSKEWKKERKFVGIRRLKRIKTDGIFPVAIYEYFCFVTNLVEAPIEIYYLYRDRAKCENWIENVKNQLSAGNTRMESFQANRVFWQMAIYGYNLTIWFRYLTEDDSLKQEPKTFQFWFIKTAGKLVYTGRQYYLNLQKYYYYREKWMNIYQSMLEIQLE